MNRFERYAVYYMPDPASELWQRASAWLGRDALSGRPVERPVIEGLEHVNADRLTAGPRHYGFHATLKAPFEPAGTDVETALLQAVDDFTQRRAPFDVRFEVAPLGDFMALRLAEESPAMKELHRDCVRELDAQRAPISDRDIARRRKARLTPEQDAYLVQWGYPYIFDQFRFHMTLTSRIACRSAQAPIRDALAAHFAAHTEAPHRIEGIALFGQVDREAPFRVVEWFAFRGERDAGARIPESASTA